MASEFARIAQHFGTAEEVVGSAGVEDESHDGDVKIEENERNHGSDSDGGRCGIPCSLLLWIHKHTHSYSLSVDNASTVEHCIPRFAEDAESAPGQLSKKKLRAMSRLKIAELKQACARPDVVEIWDVTAADPQLLVHLKAYRNTVAVPRHWSQKRAYLQGKRGIEKPPFKLPSFIEATGIGEMRQAYLEKAEAQKLKSKGRERMQPKMGKLDVDYQVLHDAFFKHQTKPKLSGMGDLYYEGKEYETDMTRATPGVVSPELREALGMEPGSAPPWLVAMQRYGPPPSYPSLRIPGLNAPIPAGGQFGYHPGGWGKPPVDEEGRPIYGDVFGEQLDEAEEDEMVRTSVEG